MQQTFGQQGSEELLIFKSGPKDSQAAAVPVHIAEVWPCQAMTADGRVTQACYEHFLLQKLEHAAP